MEKDKDREHTRISNEFNVRVVLQDASGKSAGKEIDTGKSINVSGSGILINTKEKIEKGAMMNITFMKPNSFDFFKARGTAVRVEENDDNEYNVAISFLDLSPQDKTTLDYYIKLGEST